MINKGFNQMWHAYQHYKEYKVYQDVLPYQVPLAEKPKMYSKKTNVEAYLWEVDW